MILPELTASIWSTEDTRYWLAYKIFVYIITLWNLYKKCKEALNIISRSHKAEGTGEIKCFVINSNYLIIKILIHITYTRYYKNVFASVENYYLTIWLSSSLTLKKGNVTKRSYHFEPSKIRTYHFKWRYGLYLQHSGIINQSCHLQTKNKPKIILTTVVKMFNTPDIS